MLSEDILQKNDKATVKNDYFQFLSAWHLDCRINNFE